MLEEYFLTSFNILTCHRNVYVAWLCEGLIKVKVLSTMFCMESFVYKDVYKHNVKMWDLQLYNDYMTM